MTPAVGVLKTATTKRQNIYTNSPSKNFHGRFVIPDGTGNYQLKSNTYI